MSGDLNGLGGAPPDSVHGALWAGLARASPVLKPGAAACTVGPGVPACEDGIVGGAVSGGLAGAGSKDVGVGVLALLVRCISGTVGVGVLNGGELGANIGESIESMLISFGSRCDGGNKTNGENLNKEDMVSLRTVDVVR